MSAAEQPELQSWIDRLAIQDLIYRYSDSVTRGDWDQNEAVFAADAAFEIIMPAPFGIAIEGARAIRDYISGGSGLLELLIQTASNPVVCLTGPERATATTTIHELVRGMPSGTTANDPDTPMNFEQYGVYYDEIVKIDGEWKFARRSFRSLYMESDGLDGETVAQRATLTHRP